MATKIHVGFKDGKLTSGKCEADKGKCPYGNHFPPRVKRISIKSMFPRFCIALNIAIWRQGLRLWVKAVTL